MSEGSDTQKLRSVLEGVREDIVHAVRAWRAKGGADAELALWVDAVKSGRPTVSTATRKELELTIPDFDPTIAIEFAKHPSGRVPVVVDLFHQVRHIVWIDAAAGD
jgi:hypothetical protein